MRSLYMFQGSVVIYQLCMHEHKQFYGKKMRRKKNKCRNAEREREREREREVLGLGRKIFLITITTTCIRNYNYY
jgi:hypothetical protein